MTCWFMMLMYEVFLKTISFFCQMPLSGKSTSEKVFHAWKLCYDCGFQLILGIVLLTLYMIFYFLWKYGLIQPYSGKDSICIVSLGWWLIISSLWKFKPTQHMFLYIQKNYFQINFNSSVKGTVQHKLTGVKIRLK